MHIQSSISRFVSLEDSNRPSVHAYSELTFLFRMRRFQHEATVILVVMVRRGHDKDKQFTAQVGALGNNFICRLHAGFGIIRQSRINLFLFLFMYLVHRAKGSFYFKGDEPSDSVTIQNLLNICPCRVSTAPSVVTLRY